MARKSKNKKQQTFNVYPYLGGYQHFMRNGGALPKFEEQGETEETQQQKMERLYKEQFGDRNKYNYLGGLGRVGLLGNMIQGAGELGNTIGGAFKKESYDPGGKYSKFDQQGNLRFGRSSFTNTTDKNAMLHGDNLAKYMNMSKKEKEEWVESGGRNSDLWWSTDDMTFGKRNFMDRNEDGLAKWDGSNYRVAKARNEMFKNPDTDESLFSVKQKNKDGTFTYFNEDGTVNYNKEGQTQYDRIEESTGPGGLADVNAGIMNFDFDAEGDNKLVSFEQNTDQTITKTDPDGNVTTTENKVNGITPYDPNKVYGPYTEETTTTESRQERINRELEEKDGNDETLRYGKELRGMLTKYDVGGGDSADGYDTGYFDHDRYEVPFYEHGGPHEEGETNYPGQVQLPENMPNPLDNFTVPTNDPYAFANGTGQGPINLQQEPEEINNFEKPNFGTRIKNFLQGNNDLNKPPTEADVMTDDMVENIDKKVDPNAPRVLDPTSQNDMQGVATEEEKDMGIDVNYGDTKSQKVFNKAKEITKTGVIGAGLDIIGGASEFAVDKLAPFLSSFAEGQDRHEEKLKSRSRSAEDFAPMMEETAGTGNRGFYDVNKGGYGDDLYGTGEIYGQAQQGKELMNEQPTPVSINDYMKTNMDVLRFNKEHLDKQKSFLGQMKNGGQLPEYQGGGLFKYLNPFKFKMADNILFSAGSKTTPFTKINMLKTARGKEDNIGFLNLKYDNKLGTGVEMVSVPEEWRNHTIGTALYDRGVKESIKAGYPGLISGETLDNPEATVNIWKNFNLEMTNPNRTRMDKIKGRNQFIDAGDTDFNSLIVDGKYTGSPVRLTGLNKKGETKLSEFRSFFDELSAEDKMIYQMHAQKVGGFKWDMHSPLGRSVLNGFRTKKVIGDGRTTKDYNKMPLVLGGAGLGYMTLSGDGLDSELQENQKQLYLERRAEEEGVTVEEFKKSIDDTSRIMKTDSKLYENYTKETDDLYKAGGQPGFWANVHAKRARGESPDKSKVSAETAKRFNLKYGAEIPEFLRGGGTAAEGAVLCDAYDKPVDPEKAWAADTVNNYKGPGMKYGGALPKFQGLDKSEVKAYTNAFTQGDAKFKKSDTKEILNYFIDQGVNLDTDTIISSNQSVPSHRARTNFLNMNANQANFHDGTNTTPILKNQKFTDRNGESYYMNAYPKMNEGGSWFSKATDYLQTGLGATGLTPGPVGLGADAINTGISGIRAGYNKLIGDNEAATKHAENMAGNATSMIPGPAGWAAGVAGLTKDVAGYTGAIDGNKSITTQVADSMKTSQPTMAVKGTGVVDNAAKFGGEQEAEIDMDLYYELMKAGADVKILG